MVAARGDCHSHLRLRLGAGPQREGRCSEMPLFMDVHDRVAGAKGPDVAGAHQKDLETQAKYGVKYLKYWFDESSGRIYCLVEAPNKDAAIRVHREAHGLVADEINEVTENT